MNTNKIIEAKENMVEKWTLKEAEKIAKAASKARPVLRSIEYDTDGTLTATDSYRVIKFKNFAPDDEYQLVDAKTGEDCTGMFNYPNTTRLVRDSHEIEIDIPVKQFYSMIATISKDSKNYDRNGIKIKIQGDKITFRPLLEPDNNAQMIEASLKIENANYPELEFAMNAKYLTDAFLYFKRLKIDKIKLGFSSSVRPIQFEADTMTYIIAPIRSY